MGVAGNEEKWRHLEIEDDDFLDFRHRRSIDPNIVQDVECGMEIVVKAVDSKAYPPMLPSKLSLANVTVFNEEQDWKALLLSLRREQQLSRKAS